MSIPKLFLDSSALFTGITSGTGSARILLLLAESEHIQIIISEQVVAETERAIGRKVPQALKDFRQAILASKARIVRDPQIEEVTAQLHLISHPADVPILLSAMREKVDYLVTHNRRHFIDDVYVAQRTGLRIGTPGEALNWVRKILAVENASKEAGAFDVLHPSNLLSLGIKVEWVELFMAAGVETTDELAKCEVEGLFERIQTVNKEKKIVRRTPTLSQVEEWVKKAKQNPHQSVID